MVKVKIWVLDKAGKLKQNKKLMWILAIVAAVLFIFFALETTGRIIAGKQKVSWPGRLKDQPVDEKLLARWEKDNKTLKKKIDKMGPRGVYVVIDTGRNMLFIRKGNETLRASVVSCGSGNILQDPNGDRHWVFDTPRGEFEVLSKVKDPTWMKPDWAFIEEGENIPNKREDRLEEGMMGDYALGFGDGYFIHGTLYTRMLGRNVTHGCIRVGDEDLEAVYKTVPIGAKIYIY